MSTSKLFLYLCATIHLLHQSVAEECIPSEDIAQGNKDEHIYNKFPFVSRRDWSANQWRNDICSCTNETTDDMIPLSNPQTITIHHTPPMSQSFSLPQSISALQSLQSTAQTTNKWCDISYSFVIDSIGNVFQGRPFWDDNETEVSPLNMTQFAWPNPRLIQGSVSLNSYANNIDIAVLGCYDSECPMDWNNTIAKYDSTYVRLVQLISWLCGYYNLEPSITSIVRHSFWDLTECPGDILGSKEMFASVIKDVQRTMNGGIGLCYDYSSANNDWNETGGVCSNAQSCDDDLVIYTGEDDQCMRLGQICCKIEDNGGNESKDWGSVYILVAIAIIIVMMVIVGFLWRKRNTYLLKHSSFSELAENMSVDMNSPHMAPHIVGSENRL